MHNLAQNQDSPRTVWGKVLQNLKEQRLYELHSICINLDKVSVNSNQFVIIVYEQKIFDKLQNNQDLVASFVSLGYNYNIRVVLGESNQDKLNKKLSSIEEMLGYNIKIKLGD